MSKPLAVLIVEDSESDAEIIVRLLNKADYAVVSERVETAEGMRAALAKRTWDVVISDYAMPQFDGSAALTVLQAAGQDLPFIVVSGTIGEETAVAMMRAGAHDYLMKNHLVRLGPVVARELREAVVRREHGRLDEKLRSNQALLQSVIDGTSDAVYVKDLQGRYLLCNKVVGQIVGKSMAELLGKDDTALFPPDEARQVMAGDCQILASDSVSTYEEFVTTRAGPATFLSTKGPVRDAQGRVIGLFGIARDVTESKRMEMALRARNEELERFNKAGVGRELRMIELKQELNELCVKLGEPPRYPTAGSNQ